MDASPIHLLAIPNTTDNDIAILDHVDGSAVPLSHAEHTGSARHRLHSRLGPARVIGDASQSFTHAPGIATWHGGELRHDVRRNDQRYDGYSLSASEVSSQHGILLPSRTMRRGRKHDSRLVSNA
jgi:hypothetical protein